MRDEADPGRRRHLAQPAHLRDLLTRAGFEVLEAVNGEEGVVQAELHRPDLILMDIQLPVVNGYDATRRIKGNPPCTTSRSSP